MPDLIPVQEAKVDPDAGAIRLAVGLAPDRSAGAATPRSSALEYDSNTVSVRPILTAQPRRQGEREFRRRG